MSMFKSTLLGAAAVLSIGSLASATVYSFQDGLNSYDGTQDATLYAGDPQGINTGASPTIYTNGVHRGVLSFDLSSLIGQTVTGDATLTLTMADNHPGIAFSIYSIIDANAGWAQGDNPAYAPAGAGEVTWENKSHPSTPWVGGPGLEGAGYGYNPVAVDGDVGGNYNTPVVLTIPQALVQHWIDTANAGLLIFSDTQGQAVQFRSSDDSAGRPLLEITAVPEPAALSLLGLGALAMRRRRA